MEILVEFAGLARVATRVSRLTMTVDDKATFREIVRSLAAQYPALVGDVIGPDGETLQASNMLNLNGQRMIQPSEMDQSPRHGDRLILMSVLAGG